MWSTEEFKPLVLLIASIVLLIVSGIAPADRTTWVLEVFRFYWRFRCLSLCTSAFR